MLEKGIPFSNDISALDWQACNGGGYECLRI